MENLIFCAVTNFWVNNSCKLLLKASSWSFKNYGRISDIVATSETQRSNLQWKKNSFKIPLPFVNYSSLLTEIFILHVTLNCCNDFVAIFFKSFINIFN